MDAWDFDQTFTSCSLCKFISFPIRNPPAKPLSSQNQVFPILTKCEDVEFWRAQMGARLRREAPLCEGREAREDGHGGPGGRREGKARQSHGTMGVRWYSVFSGW